MTEPTWFETTHEDVDTWPTTHGDQVHIVQRETRKLGPDDEVLGTETSFHWTVVNTGNGEKVDTSGETFTRKEAAVEGALRHHPRVDEP